MRWRKSALVLSAVTLIVLVSGILVFQDNITRFVVNPRQPFQVAPPPPPPAYGARGAWILWPDQRGSAGLADVFYVHSTTYYSGRSWNGPINDDDADEALRRKAAPNEAGPFLAIGPVYGPRYRQATLFASFTHKFDGVAARQLAYEDLKDAFSVFLKSIPDERRPIILVGYGQGGLHVEGLLAEFFQDNEKLRNQLAAAYIIEESVPTALFKSTLKETPPCNDASSIRCIVSYTDLEPRFDEEMRRIRSRTMVWTDDGELDSMPRSPILCINPLTWTGKGGYVEPSAHVGAASATGLRMGKTPPAISQAVGAECHDGVLIVDKPAQSYLRRGNWFGAKWRAQHFNLFYFDLREDAKRRARNTAQKLEDEYRFLDPIETPVEVEKSPINKVPTP